MSPRYLYLDAAGQALPGPSELAVAVHDTTTQLIWSRATIDGTAVGDDADDGLTQEEAQQAVAELDLAGATGWRLPTIQELLTLVDYSRHGPAIDIETFPDTRSDWYWTSTDAAWSSVCAWFVGFDNGSSDGLHRDSNAFVRAVRSVSSGQ